jgi:hypothetical protein
MVHIDFVITKEHKLEEGNMIRNLLNNLMGDKYTESNEKYAKINFAIVILMFVISAVMLFFLPEQLPILHSGDTEYPIPSYLGVWLIPIIALFVNITFIKQNRLSKMNSMLFGVALIGMTVYYITLM